MNLVEVDRGIDKSDQDKNTPKVGILEVSLWLGWRSKSVDLARLKKTHMKIDAEQDIFQDTSTDEKDVEKRE